jgi:ferredoxin-NADP reductase
MAAPARVQPIGQSSPASRPLPPRPSLARPGSLPPIRRSTASPGDRTIAAYSDRYNATLVDRRGQTDMTGVFVVRLDPAGSVPAAFVPGQYLALGLEVDGMLVQRPYSTSSPAPASDDIRDLEFYVRLVPGPGFTPLLWQLPVGRRLRVAAAKGSFALDPDDPGARLFVSTGTGVAPFVSMLDTALRLGGMPPTVLVHGVSFPDELGFRERLEAWQRAMPNAFAYVPTVSRPDSSRSAGWNGRTGRVESIIDDACRTHHVDAALAAAYLCGNPGMISSVQAVLRELGFLAERIRHEQYWPEARSLTAA